MILTKQKLLLLEQKRALDIFDNENISITGATVEELHKLAELNPNLFSTKYARWGCQFKCVKCNKYKVLTGGKRSLLEISKLINAQKYSHRKFCKHPKWEESWSLHKVEIDHTYVENTLATSVDDETFVDIPDTEIVVGHFTVGRKYLIFATHYSSEFDTFGQVSHSSRVAHGGTGFDESVFSTKNLVSGQVRKSTWFGVWTAVDGENITQQRHVGNSIGSVLTDQHGTLVIELSVDLIEGEDWEFSLDTTGRALTTSYVADTSLTIASGDHQVGDVYLVMAYGQGNAVDINTDFSTRLVRSGEASDTTPEAIITGDDPQDGVEEKLLMMYMKPFTLGAADNTFTVENKTENANEGDYFASSIFAINLEVFADTPHVYDASDLTLNESPLWGDLIGTITYTPSQTGNVWIIGNEVTEHKSSGSNNSIKERIQVDQVDAPDGQTGAFGNSGGWGSDDLMAHTNFVVVNLDETEHVIDWEGHGDNFVPPDDPVMKYRSLFVISFELPNPPNLAVPSGQDLVLKRSSKGIQFPN